MRNFHFITILTSFGFYSLAGCNKDTKDTSDGGGEISTSKMNFVSASTNAEQERAREVIQRLQENVNIDLPTDVNKQEEIILDIEKRIVSVLENVLMTGDFDSFQRIFTSNSRVSAFPNELGKPVRIELGVHEYHQKSEQYSGRDAIEKWTTLVSTFSHMIDTRVDIHEVVELKENQVELKVFLDLRGEHNSGQLQQERGWATLICKKEQGDWKLDSLLMPEKETLTISKPLFTDITESSGLSTVPLYSRLEALRRGGYAISVGDLNGDGLPDIYVGGWGDSKVYSNNGDGTFADITDKTGLSFYEGNVVDRVKAAAISDLDNDGDQDVVLSRFIDDASEDVLVYKNDGSGHFTVVRDAINKIGQFDRAMPMTVADFNNDGFNDLYVGFPGARDFTYLDANPNPLQTNGLFVNNGDATFTDVSASFGLHQTNEQAYPHASVKADFNGDGNVDLLIADDRRGTSQIYENTGSSFKMVSSEKSGVNNRAWAMGIAVGDFDNDGLPDLYYSNIDFLSAKRIDSFLQDDLAEDLFVGNHLYKNMGDGTFKDVTEEAGVGWAGEAAAGAEWVDFDNDGDLDLFVLNGLWTGPGDQELSSLFVRAYASELFLEQNNHTKIHQQLSKDAISLRNPGFNNMIIQSLMHFNGNISDLDKTVDSDQSIPTLQLGGNQRNVLFRNNGDGTFTEIGFLAGLDSIDDGYMPAFSDINQDGKVDFLVRACDPGTTAYQYPSLRVFENQIEENQSLILTLEGDGSISNRDAVGAKVIVETKSGSGNEQLTMTREMNSVSGAAQSEKAVFFGIEDGSVVTKVTIVWPSGNVQELSSITTGRHHIKELDHFGDQ